MSELAKIRKDLRLFVDPARAAGVARFFKTGVGEYGEGDRFLGVTVPEQRVVAKRYAALELSDIEALLGSLWHEERLTALLILVTQFQKGDAATRKKIFEFYIDNLESVNNWDLVDSSADKIVGGYLLDRPKTLLTRLAKSKNVWERRVAIVATLHFIRNDHFDETIALAEKYFIDSHDLIAKATGWMLREMGKRSPETLISFLNAYATRMPRTMLRYSIERLSVLERARYLAMRKK